MVTSDSGLNESSRLNDKELDLLSEDSNVLVRVAAKEIRALRLRVVQLQNSRSELDCRYSGQYMDVDGRHCLCAEPEHCKPCMRCELEMANERLRKKISEYKEFVNDISGED